MKILLLCIVIFATLINFIGLSVAIGLIPFDDPAIITAAQKLKSAEQGRFNLLIVNFVLWITALVIISYDYLIRGSHTGSGHLK